MDGALKIGKKKNGQEFGFSSLKSRVCLVCGKRGSGKSYTMGVIAEEIFQYDDVAVLIIDPIGIYWTMALENEKIKAGKKKLPVKILIAGDPVEHFGSEVVGKMSSLGVNFQRLSLCPSEITPDGWCLFYNYSISEPSGIVLYRAVQNLGRSGRYFSLDDIVVEIEQDTKAQDKTKEALINRLSMTKELGLFSDTYTDTSSFFSPLFINVIDLSMLHLSAYGLRNLIVGTVLRIMFKKSVLEYRYKNLGLKKDIRKMWLLMDEAHQFIPSGKNTLSKDIITTWVKEGRQPGLSCVFTTQQPSAIDNDILSQCDLVVIHRVTNIADIQALNKLSSEYTVSDLKDFLLSVKEPGDAFILDDMAELYSIIKIRHRWTKHGEVEV